MKSNLLLPPNFKIMGLVLLIPSLILGYLCRYHDLRFKALTVGSQDNIMFNNNHNLTDEIALTGILLALLMIAFARLKNEDEYIHFMRLESWQWAVVINFILLILATWIFYGDNFFDVMIYNMLTIPILFIIRFHYLLFQAKRSEAKTYPL